MQEQYLKKRSELIQQQMSNQSRESFSIHLYVKLRNGFRVRARVWSAVRGV